MHDYEVLIRELPDDKKVAEGLFHAQVALKKSRGEEVYNMKFGGEVEEITGVDQFRAAVSSPGELSPLPALVLVCQNPFFSYPL